MSYLSRMKPWRSSWDKPLIKYAFDPVLGTGIVIRRSSAVDRCISLGIPEIPQVTPVAIDFIYIPKNEA